MRKRPSQPIPATLVQDGLLPFGMAPQTAYKNFRFTEKAQEIILDALAAGEYTYTACELAGVSKATFDKWLRHGKAEESGPYRKFYLCVKEARLRGMSALEDNKKVRAGMLEQSGQVTNSANPLVDALFTDNAQEQIVGYLSAGTFLDVAAEASGIPALIVRRWIERGKAAQTIEDPYYIFYTRIMQAQAAARAGAEMRVLEDNPLAWLLNGPARDKGDNNGWTKQNTVTSTTTQTIQLVTKWGGAALPAPSVPAEFTVEEIENDA